MAPTWSVVREYRIPLPMTVDEYRKALLYSVTEASKNETGGGEGIEIINNEPYNDASLGGKGHHTKKIIHLASKLPILMRQLAPNYQVRVIENSWNAYPYCKTEYSIPEHLKQGFYFEIETWCKEERVSKSDTANKHFKLTDAEARKRTVEFIDVINDSIPSTDYKADEDPTKFKSTKTGRGPVSGADWFSSCESYMCVYKLYKLEFQWFGLQANLESEIMKFARRLLTNFNRQTFCWMDKWYGLSDGDLAQKRDQSKDELETLRKAGAVRGYNLD